MKKAFTLLELLVVIGIIGILVALGAVSYSTAQKKARDARRQSDLKAAQNTLEQCYSVNNYSYPIDTDFSNSGGVITITCPADNSIRTSISDPINTAPHMYSIITSTIDTYEIRAKLEAGSEATVSAQQ